MPKSNRNQETINNASSKHELTNKNSLKTRDLGRNIN
jgi:hypothetical protein